MKYIPYYLSLFFTFCLVQINAQTENLKLDTKVVLLNEQAINSVKSEFSPAFYENGIVFLSNIDIKKVKKVVDKNLKNKTYSIFIARRGPDGVLLAPEPFATELTSPFHEGPLTFDALNKNIYFTRNNQENGKKKTAKDGFTKLQVLMATKDNESKWSNVVRLPFNDDQSNACHPSISVNNDKLYFASDRPGGYGGYDIYVVKKVGESWGEPINLGPNVNSDKNEVFPYIHPDGTIFFASNGRQGAGGLDLFFAKPKSETSFKVAQNMGLPFNSKEDDFSLILDLDRKNGYFSSNRGGSKGEDDIYTFNTSGIIAQDEEELLAEQQANRKIQLFASDRVSSEELKDVKITYTNLNALNQGDIVTDTNGNIISLGAELTKMTSEENIKSVLTNNEGMAEVALGAGDFLIMVEKEGYQPKQFILKSDDLRKDILLLMDKADGLIPMAGILKGADGKPVAGATITLVDDITGEVTTVTTDANGRYNYFVKPGTNYTATITKDNYLSVTKKFSTTNLKEGEGLNFDGVTFSELSSPLATGKKFNLSNVYYNFNDASLRPDARKDLDVLVQLLKQYPAVEIELGSHTDSRGTNEYNEQLSQKRAESVVAYLVEKGIESNRIVAKGYGESQLINKCTDGVDCIEASHQLNRRTVVKVTKGIPESQITYIDKVPVTDESGGQLSNNRTNSASAENGASATKYGEFWVIAGSFNKPENAEAQLQKLRKLGYTSTDMISSEGGLIRVRVKVCATLDEARNLLRELKFKHGEPTFVLYY